MSQADDIRKYCQEHYVTPARAAKAYSVTIRAGDVHNALRLKNSHPSVCSAIGSLIFEESLKLKRISVDGPLNGSNTLFTFLVL